MKKLFFLLMLGIGLLSTSCEKEPFLEYELPNLGNTLEFTADGGSIYVDITAECSYEILCKDNWVSYIETYSGIAVTAQANLETNIRESEIRILYYHRKDQIYKSIKVKQAAFEPKLEIDKTELNYDVNGGSKTIYVTTNAEFNFSESSDWISCTKSSNSVKITATASTVANVRSANIKIYLPKYDLFKNVKVTQKQFEPMLEVEDISTLNFSYLGGEQQIAITANFDYEVSSNKKWLTYTKNSNGIVLNIAETDEAKDENREAKLTIGSSKYNLPAKTINVSQSYIPTSLATIEYTTIDGRIIDSFDSYDFDATILSNTNDQNGICKILFDKPITKIGSCAFKDCSSLTSVTIPDRVTWIGSSAFEDCSYLRSVTIPDSVTSIGGGAFIRCTSLTSVTIPDSVTSIGDSTFYGCYILTSVTIPNSVTSIGEKAFSGCSRLTSITIPDSVTSIGKYAFSDCRSLTSITIPDSVIYIGSSAFEDCSCLRSVTIPDSVTSIKDYAFSGCSSLTSVTIPDSVTSIGDDAFYSCSSLTSVTIGNSVTSIGDCAFVDCTSLRSVTIPDSVTSIGGGAFIRCYSLTSVTIPDSVTSIGGHAFSGCYRLTSVTIPNSVTSIGKEAFSGCTGELVINSKIVAHYYSATPSWLEESKFTTLTIGDNITYVGQNAFNGCSSLTSVTIPDSVTSIKDYAFFGCSLTSVYCKPTIPPTIGTSAFSYNATDIKIYVPRNSVEAYKSARYWKDYASYIEGYDFE